ncbi:PP2C family protein-serine/threonine phosphatase [Streptomyces sp. NPDC058953]|uniref:PP2C family protein-serine/threonine phosphatase n=1 Tax=unclassified Streptomyces TaxID=2593676 RepID=UPI0036A51113
MPSHVFEDRPGDLPEDGSGTGSVAVDALISRTRRLRGAVDRVRRDTVTDEDHPQDRWRRALCDLAVHQLDDLGAQLGQLRRGLSDEAPGGEGDRALTSPPVRLPYPDPFEQVEQVRQVERMAPAGPQEPQPRYDAPELAAYEADHAQGSGSLLSRVGSAEWNLLTDAVSWSDELYGILGRPAGGDAMTLDELPSVVHPDDQALLTTLVTGCLVDGRPIDGEFRVVRPDRQVRTVHMMGEPVLGPDGSTASMWAVFRDVSALRRSELAVRESGETLRRRRHAELAERRMAVELQEAVLPPWRGSLTFPIGGPAELDVAARYFPSGNSDLIGGDWYDALELPTGAFVLSVGDLTGHGVAATSSMAMLLGALRGMAVAGVAPGAVMGHLNHLLETSVQPTLGSAVCCQIDPARHTLTWAQAGHPAPLLFRDGTGRTLPPPDGVLLGATSAPEYEQNEVQLRPGDLLVLHTDGLTRTAAADEPSGTARLLGLAPVLAGARDAQDGVRLVAEAFGGAGRTDDACVMVARIGE